MVEGSGKLPYRPCVGVMVINRDGLVFVGRRADMPGEPEGDGQWWQMPQGGIDEGEAPSLAALRELHEETGIRTATIIGETRDWLVYDLPPQLIGVAWGGKFRGQRQKWFAVRFLGKDAEIDIGPRDGHQAEFEAWRWAPVEDLVRTIVPFKRDVYSAVVNELGRLAQPLK
jgi:putative (di)nucleoside polyphosphate hydrolase